MTKRKQSTFAVGDAALADQHLVSSARTSNTPPLSSNTSTARNPEPSTSALIICRNKHWRYISSFHGPWLQLPPEVLESLAYSNYSSPRPRPIDPAVFFDLVKIRHLVQDATDLAVRAANGTTSSSLPSNLAAGHGFLGGGGAAALGLGIGGAGANAKLSRERKHRMRELATQKLSHAYRLDEIAASVATMQSASPLEDVAKLVLQRSANDNDAKYVHFFHEKIPSRMLAECTSLQPLDDIVQDQSTNGAPLRTRAVTRMFKDDFAGAARDLTEGLAIARCMTAQHNAGRGQLQLANALGGAERRKGGALDWKSDVKIEEDDQPCSLEPQLLFHRAGVYLALACQQIHDSLLEPDHVIDSMRRNDLVTASVPAERDIHIIRREARKVIKNNAKRALRDYIGFVSYFDYTSGLSSEAAEDCFQKADTASNGSASSTRSKGLSKNELLEMSGNSSLSNGDLSDALIPFERDEAHRQNGNTFPNASTLPTVPEPEVHPVSSLFSSTPPSNLPPYPATSQALVSRKQSSHYLNSSIANHQLLPHSGHQEAITYHPLLTDALHSILLCHSLMQTSPKEHLRHAHMVARLVRVCDGYPIFLAARSPSRADWIEVVRRANNWIGLQESWDILCSPAPLPGYAGSSKKEETEEQMKERHRQEAIMEALADERVHDEASFQAAVAARERRAGDQRKEELGQNSNGPKRWAQEDGKEYAISTERAEAVARWVREAPLTFESAGKPKRRPRNGKSKTESKSGIQGISTEFSHLSVGTESA